MRLMDIQKIKLRYGIIGNDPKLNMAINKAIQVAPTDLSILISGESGVGKDVFSRIIHENSLRKHVKQGKGLISVNCGAIPEGTIESELFGHVKGAFTGAERNRKGYFEEADGGTIFLDEIGELPLAMQVKLLRVLENGEIMPVGSSTAQKINVRIVAATNVDLVAAVRDGHFREDLYYRLQQISISIPPLRERKDDIPLLFRKFSSDVAEKYNMPPIFLTEDARQYLMNYPWYGNIREL
ncbi:MAG: sigma-54-dependent Fis family transcriptional regulator, partial [Bacteroidales bacterium]|nr:sigma-54-dependent Fis family transcriptional regulator [Bacteroidales bacterium]